MFFRRKKTPSGQVLQLVESFRNREGQPRQRLVVSLGNAKMELQHQPVIARLVEDRLYGRRNLLEQCSPPEVQEWVSKIVRRVESQGRWCALSELQEAPQTDTPSSKDETIDGVILHRVGHQQTSLLGPVLVGLHAWSELGLDRLLESLDFNQSQRDAAKVAVINRLVEPVSEHALRDWLTTTAMPELLPSRLELGGKDRFYRAGDRLHRYKDEIEKYLCRRERELFDLERTILLYDLTNTYFEGAAEANPKARRGKSKHKRNDCPQVVLGMVFDEFGFELAHEVLEGDTNDSTTLEKMLTKLSETAGIKGESEPSRRPLVVVDAGVATQKNLSLLRAKKFKYLVNDSRRGRKKYKEYFERSKMFRPISDRSNEEAVEVYRMEAPQEKEEEGGEQKDREKERQLLGEKEYLVLCRSAGRQIKEEAMVSRAEERLRKELQKLSNRLSSGRLKDGDKIEQAVGRLRAKHTRAAKYYTITKRSVGGKPEKGKPAYALSWKLKEEARAEDDALLGCYVLRSNEEKFSAEELWHLYMVLTRAEEGFRLLKSELGLRPIRHHTEWRGDTHVFITVLAYHLLQSMLHRLRQKGDKRSWATIKRLLQTHAYTTIVLPTRAGRTYRIRKAGEPEPAQIAVYEALGVEWKNLPIIRVVVEPKEEREATL